MEHILMLGGANYTHIPFKKEGFELTLLEAKNKEHKINRDIYNNVYLVNESNKEENWICSAKEINAKKKIDKILTFNELNQMLASKIAKTLNIEYYDETTLQRVYNKKIMRDFITCTELNKVPFLETNDLNEIDEFILEHGFPIVIKPIDGIAGKEVYIIYNQEELNNFISTNPIREFYLEKFITGKEYSVEAFSYNSSHYIINVTEKIKDKIKCTEKGHIIPAYNLEVEDNEKIKDFLVVLLDKLNIKEGLSHTELIINENGIYLVETHVRMAGGLIGKLINQTFGCDPAELYAKSLKEKKLKKELVNWDNTYSSIHFLFPNKSGVIQELNHEVNMVEYGDLQEIILFKKVGDRVNSLGNDHRLAALIFKGNNPHLYEKLSEDIFKKFNVIIN